MFGEPQMQLLTASAWGTQVQKESGIFPMQDGNSLTCPMQHLQESHVLLQAMQTIDQAASRNRL